MPAAAPARRGRKPARDRRREIADAALRVISAGGLGRFTSLAIAREVGVTDAALFRHFPSKEAIVDAAIDRVEELLFEGFPPQADDPIERLGAFFRRRVEVIRAHPGISTLVATGELAKAGSAAGVRRAEEFRRRSAGFVRECLEEAERRRLLAPGVEAEEAGVVVLGALLALAHSRMFPGREPAVALAPGVWRALESLLRGRAPRARSAGRRPPPIGRHQPGGDPR
jgi:AcrR family transcriptional regulator